MFCLALSSSLLAIVTNRSIHASKRSDVRKYQDEQTLQSFPPKLWKGGDLDPLTEADKEEEKLGFTRSGFNQFRSDRIPLDRDVPDTRDPR